MEQKKAIPLVKMIEDLGYENPKDLNNWLRDILQKKEGSLFGKFIAEFDYSEFRESRTYDIFCVTPEAKTLVDNICFLKPYMRFFTKSTGDKTSFAPYRRLYDGISAKIILTKHEEMRTKLDFQKRISETALNNLDSFKTFLLETGKINIVCESIKEMIFKNNPRQKLDSSKSYIISIWTELSELKAELERTGGNSELYRKIGEKHIQLGDYDEAIEALDESVRLQKTNGIAWILKAHSELQLLKGRSTKLTLANARTDFSGTIEYPISGEEYAINQELEDAMDEYNKMHDSFIESAFKAFEFWPELEYKDQKGMLTKYHARSTKAINEIEVEVERDKLFFHFVLNLTNADFKDKKKAESFIRILRRFQHEDYRNNPFPEMHLGMFSSEANFTDQFKLKLVEIFSWISDDDLSLALDYMIKGFTDMRMRKLAGRAGREFSIATSSRISNQFLKYLGEPEYLKLVKSIESNFIREIESVRVNKLCQLKLRSFFLSIKEKEYEIFKSKTESGKCKKQGSDTILAAIKNLEGWENCLAERLWVEKNSINDLPDSFITLIFLGSLLNFSESEDEIKSQILNNIMDDEMVSYNVAKQISKQIEIFTMEEILTYIKMQNNSGHIQSLIAKFTETMNMAQSEEYNNDSF